MSSINNIKLSFIESKFDDFRDKLKDLSSIDDIIKLKIELLRITIIESLSYEEYKKYEGKEA